MDLNKAMEGLNKENFIIKQRTGETLVKKPGSLNGYDFIIELLTDCDVFILDHTEQVQIDNCTNCRIFIGPVAGSAFIRDCKDCKIQVACRQLRLRDCQRLDIGLYCFTKPALETSSEIAFSCWRGAYHGLTEHFAQANLKPEASTWWDVHNFNDGEEINGLLEHYTVDKNSTEEYWEVPVYDDEGEEVGSPEDPVPFNGRVYVGDGEREKAVAEDPQTTATDADEDDDDDDDDGRDESSQLGDSLENTSDKEAGARAEKQAQAAAYLSTFYKERKQAKSARKRQNREEEAAYLASTESEASSSDGNVWARTADLIDFTQRAEKGADHACDMARFRQVLRAAKDSNL